MALNTVTINLDTDFAQSLREVLTDWGHGSRDRDDLLAALLALQAEALASGAFEALVLVGIAWQHVAGVPYGSIPEPLAA